MTTVGNGVPGRVPPAFKRVGIPEGASVTIRSKRNAPLPALTVEDADGNDVLKISVNADGKLDMDYDPARITEAAQRLLVEAKALLHPHTSGGRIRVHADNTATPPATGVS